MAKFLERLVGPASSGAEEASAPSQSAGETPAASTSSRVKAYTALAQDKQRESDQTRTHDVAGAPREEPDEFEGLREGLEAALAVAREAAGKIKAAARAEAEAAIAAASREAAGKLEEAKREAGELRALAQRALEEAETDSTKIRRRADAVFARTLQDAESKAKGVLEATTREAAEKLEEAKAEANRLRERAQREAGKKLEGAKREADELRERARREAEAKAARVIEEASRAAAARAEAAEQREESVDKRVALIKERLLELADGLDEIDPDSEHTVLAGGEIESEEALDESLRAVAQSIQNRQRSGAG